MPHFADPPEMQMGRARFTSAFASNSARSRSIMILVKTLGSQELNLKINLARKKETEWRVEGTVFTFQRMVPMRCLCSVSERQWRGGANTLGALLRGATPAPADCALLRWHLRPRAFLSKKMLFSVYLFHLITR